MADPRQGSSARSGQREFMQLRDDQVVDGTAFYDSISFSELWSTVIPADT